MAADLADSEGASILVRDTSADELRCLAAFDAMSEKLMEASISVPIEGSIAGTILVSQEPLTVPNVQCDPCLCLHREDDQQTRFKVRSLLGVPLRLGDQRIGVLLALNKRSDNEFSRKDVKTLVALATHAATVIENVRLGQEVVDRSELQARLEELVAWAHTVTHDLKSLLGLIIGYAEVLVEHHAGLADEELSRYLRAVARSGRKINYMVNAGWLTKLIKHNMHTVQRIGVVVGLDPGFVRLSLAQDQARRINEAWWLAQALWLTRS